MIDMVAIINYINSHSEILATIINNDSLIVSYDDKEYVIVIEVMVNPSRVMMYSDEFVETL